MATFEETLDKAIEVAVKRAILKAHPVGSLYLSLTDENPSAALGGGARGSKLAQGDAYGEQIVDTVLEQRYRQGYRISRVQRFYRGETLQVEASLWRTFRAGIVVRYTPQRTLRGVVSTLKRLVLQKQQSILINLMLMHPVVHRFTEHQQRYNPQPWQLTFGRGLNEYI